MIQVGFVDFGFGQLVFHMFVCDVCARCCNGSVFLYAYLCSLLRYSLTDLHSYFDVCNYCRCVHAWRSCLCFDLELGSLHPFGPCRCPRALLAHASCPATRKGHTFAWLMLKSGRLLNLLSRRHQMVGLHKSLMRSNLFVGSDQ